MGLSAYAVGREPTAVVRWDVARPTSVDGARVVDWFHAPTLSGNVRLRALNGKGEIAKDGQNVICDLTYTYPKPTYMNFNDVIKSVSVGMPYGRAVRFVIDGTATFWWVDVSAKDGTITRVNNVACPFSESVVFRMDADTSSWGSPNEEYLFIPFYDRY